MKLFKNRENKTNWLQVITIFILGALVLSNIFLFWNNLGLQKEVEKLKADDMAIAQAINTVLGQLKAK
ncbi:MAG: hypothetical protein NT116_02095 [Candidatus Parcubacteria bacterium]|nr:hypothetical protein [Candidatus Parcubacteria bacterium]